MKKTVALILSACFIAFAAAGCGDKKNSASKPEDPIRKQTETILQNAKDAVTGEDLYLTNKGKSDYKIVLPSAYTSTEGYAATYLQETLYSATGKSFEIVYDGTLTDVSNDDYYLSIGRTTLADKAGVKADRNEFTADGFILTLKGNTVFVLGGSDMGTFYGAQEFMAYTIDYEAYAPTAVYFDKTSTVRMKKFDDIKVVPSIAARMGILGTQIDLASHAIMRCRSNLNYCGAMNGEQWLSSKLCYHSISEIDGIKDHEEWFDNGQICQTNEDAIAYVAEKTAEVVKAAPEYTIYFELGNADNKKTCSCAACAAAAEANGGYGGLYVVWLNKVAKAVENILTEQGVTDKEWYLLGLTYNSYKDAPVIEKDGKYLPVNENVICGKHVGIRYAPIDACYAHGLSDDTCRINKNEGYKKSLYGWAAITDTYLIWSYEIEFGNFFAFFDDYGSIAPNVRDYSDLGVKVWFSQVGQNSRNPFAALRVYLSSKLGWNKDADAEVLFKKFFEGYYREAAPYMLEYFNLLRANKSRIDTLLNNDGHLVYATQTGNYMSAEYWQFSLLENLSKVVNKAYAAIIDAGYSGDEYEEMRLRIRADEMFLSALYLTNYETYMAPSDFARLKDAFYKDNRLLGNTRFKENEML